MELLGCLEAGVNVVSSAFYPLLYPECGLEAAVAPVREACRKGNSSVFVSGIDPGWAMDILPILASGVVADIHEIRVQEVFNYALYDQPRVVREVIGFGQGMAQLPRMLEDGSRNAYRVVRLKSKLGTRSMASGEIRFDGAMLSVAGTVVALPAGARTELDVRVFLDKSVLEVFADKDRIAVTRIVYPPAEDVAVALFAEGGTAHFTPLDIWRMNSIW